MTGGVLVVDNHDSFTWNLVQSVAVLTGEWPRVVRNDEVSDDQLRAMHPDAVIVSPGPGHPGRPRDFGVSRAAIADLGVPLLGVCLGHQGLAHHFGARIERAPAPMHGRTSEILHDGSELFEGIPQGFTAVRYHSLAIRGPLPAELVLTAWTTDGIPMAVRHRDRPLWGVQFHPESIGTEHGPRLVENFLDAAQPQRRRPQPRRRPSEPVAERRSGRAAGVTRPRVRTLHDPPSTEALFVHLYGEQPHAFWLDSSLHGPGGARFSYLGAGRPVVIPPGQSALDVLDAATRRGGGGGDLPFPFAGGFVGYLGYELKRELGFSATHHSPHPDAALLEVDRMLVVDHETGRLHLVASGEGAGDWLDRTESRVRSLPPVPPPAAGAGAGAGAGALSMRRSRAQYQSDVARCLDEIAAGESYEICLTTMLTAPPVDRPLDVYRRLRARAPAPYAAYLRLGDLAVLCASPERFLRVTADGEVSSKPIKGTAARMADPADDARARDRLAASVKDRAENLMIVDLVRNDLGRVCEAGSVSVPRLMDVESFATVHHLVSTVRGRLRPGLGAVDCVRAAFPGGSMTGAPKARTIEILDRLETGPRGVYSGSLGWFGRDGAAELNIVIRTAVATPQGVEVGTGGAVVALSDPEREWDEALLKAATLVEALGLAERRPAMAPEPDVSAKAGGRTGRE